MPPSGAAPLTLAKPVLAAAVEHHRAGRFGDALALYDRVLALDPAHADALRLSGIAAHQSGKSEPALARFRAALALRPAFAEAYNNLGGVLADLGRPAEAVDVYRKAIRCQGGLAEAHGNLGAALQALGRLADAEEAYRLALRLDPGFVNARFNLGRLLRACGRIGEAAECFHAVVTAVPGHDAAWRLLALALGTLRHPDAEACLRHALSHDPGDGELGLALGQLLTDQGRLAEAEETLRPVVDANPEGAIAPFTLGRVLQEQGRPADAVQRYRLALDRDPGLTGAFTNLGLTLQDLGEHGAALSAFHRALALEPCDSQALNNLGTAHDEADRLASAAAAYRRALAVRPDYGKALNNLAGLLRSSHDHDAACRLGKRAIAALPDFADSYTSLGLAMQELDRAAEAERLHRRAIRLDPQSRAAHTNLGLALQVRGRMAEAEAAHRAALAIDPRYGEARANLGMLFSQTGKEEEAEAALLEALDLDPSLEAARFNLGIVRLTRGELAQGWDAYQSRFRSKGYEDRAIAAPAWQGEGIAGRRLLVWREQGVGDEMMFASCYRDLESCAGHVVAGHVVAGHVVIECDPRLVSLFARSFPWATVRAQTVGADGRETIQPPDVDIHIAAGALPRLLRPALDSFDADGPWLVPDPARVAFWRDRLAALGPGLKVGIGWRSQKMTEERKAAYTTLDQWGPLLALPGAVFVNLQYGECTAELEAAERRFGVRIHRWADLDLKDDFEAAAALTANLDLVISPAMSAGELAGALGVPVWRFGARDWTQLGTAVRPWFPAMRLFQPRPGESFDGVLARMAGMLNRCRTAEPKTAEPLPQPRPQPSVTSEAPSEAPDIEPLVAQAIACYRAGNPAEAERLCRTALDAVPGHGVALHLLGILARRRGDAAEAAAVLARAVTADPGNAAAHAALSDAWQALGQADAADAALRHAIAARPDAAEHWVNRTALLRSLGRSGEAARTVVRAVSLRPDLPLAHTHLGNILAEHGDADGAALCHRRTLALDPAGPDALNNLGTVLVSVERFAEAATVLRRAVAVAPDRAGAWTNLGNALDPLGRTEEAEACLRAAVARAPGMAETHANLAMHLRNRDRRAEAAEAYRQALEADPQHAQSHFNLGLLRLEEGVLRQGWAEYEWRFGTPQSRAHARRFAVRAWRGENISANRLLVWREQGVGDEILFASCYPDLERRAGHLVIECDRRLVSLFARSFPSATVRAETPDPRDVDVHAAAGSLPRLLRTDLKRFPERPSWLVPDPARVALWRDRLAALGPGLKVGIGWRSQVMTERRKASYTALDQWGPLLALPGAVFVNLQYGECAAELEAAERRFGVRIHRWADLDLKDDFEAAAALTANLDLVISPAMSAGELAGALGVPVWRFGACDWTQTGTAVRPWYPSMRLFQPRPGEGLGDVLARMGGVLRRLLPPGSADPISAPPAPSSETPAEDPDTLLERAAAHHRDGRLAQAAPLYERVLARQPGHPVALHLSGLLMHQSGDTPAAAERIAEALARRPAYAAAHSSLGTVLLALDRPAAAVERFRRALAVQPASAAALTNLGNALDAAGDPAGAEAAHRRAVRTEPGLAEAHDNRGAVLARLGRAEEAEACHREALRLLPASVAAWINLSVAARMCGRPADAAAAVRRALALDPSAADGLANLGRLWREMGAPDEAMTWCGRALALAPGQPAASFNRGLMLLERGELREGWAGYDQRFRARAFAGSARAPGVPAWDGGDLAGRCLLVWREQGIGDEILFASCLSDAIARAGAVIVECEPRLVPLFVRSFPAAVVRAEPADSAAPCPEADVHAAMGSLPRWLRPTLPDFPQRRGFLIPDAGAAQRWERRLEALGPGLRVGFAWRSGLMTPERAAAYTSLDRWGALFGVPGVRLVTLQYGDCAAELAEARRRFGVPLPVWDDLDLKNDLDEVAALMSRLDLVIAPASSVGELAAALGVPVWRFGPAGDWSTLGTRVRPWFPSMRVFPAGVGLAVADLLPRIAAELRRLSGA